MTTREEIIQQFAITICDELGAGDSDDDFDVESVIEKIAEGTGSFEKYAIDGPRAWAECESKFTSTLDCGARYATFERVQAFKGEQRRDAAFCEVGAETTLVWRG